MNTSTHNDSFDSERSTIDESEYDSTLPTPFSEYKYLPSAMATVLRKVISLSTDTQSKKNLISQPLKSHPSLLRTT